MKNELNLSVETSDDEWFEIFSYEETETDLNDISELIIFKTNTDFYSNFNYNCFHINIAKKMRGLQPRIGIAIKNILLFFTFFLKEICK